MNTYVTIDRDLKFLILQKYSSAAVVGAERPAGPQMGGQGPENRGPVLLGKGTRPHPGSPTLAPGAGRVACPLALSPA